MLQLKPGDEVEIEGYDETGRIERKLDLGGIDFLEVVVGARVVIVAAAAARSTSSDLLRRLRE